MSSTHPRYSEWKREQISDRLIALNMLTILIIAMVLIASAITYSYHADQSIKAWAQSEYNITK